jgi:hypothetical protein
MFGTLRRIALGCCRNVAVLFFACHDVSLALLRLVSSLADGSTTDIGAYVAQSARQTICAQANWQRKILASAKIPVNRHGMTHKLGSNPACTD